MVTRFAAVFALATLGSFGCSAILGADFDRGPGDGSDGASSASGDDGTGRGNGSGNGEDGGLASADPYAFDAAGITEYAALLAYTGFGGGADGSGQTRISASAGSPPNLNCATLMSAGSCALTLCSYPDGGGVVGAPFLSMGALSVTGGAAPIAVAETQEMYSSASSATPQWSAGDALRFRAGGAAFPGFDLTVVVPPTMNVTSPAVTDEAVEQQRSASLNVQWTPVAGGTAIAFLSPYENSGPSISCTVPTSAGIVSIPSVLLEQLDAQQGGNLVVYAGNVTHESIGSDAYVSVLAYAAAAGTIGLETYVRFTD